jgi:tight adherence protein B
VAELILIILGAAAGGLVAIAGREAVLATPSLARWLVTSTEPLMRAGREGYSPSESERRRLAALGCCSLLALTLLVAGPGPLAVIAVAGPAAAGSAISRRRARYRRAVERRMPEIATAVADALAGGCSVRAALMAASISLEGAPAVEMSRLAAELETGSSTARALSELRERLGSERVDAFATALLSQQGAGGDLSGLMRSYAAAAAERDRVAEDARAATTQARFTGMLVVALPGGAALFAELLEPGFTGSVISDPAGIVLLAIAAALQLAGFVAIRGLGRVGD